MRRWSSVVALLVAWLAGAWAPGHVGASPVPAAAARWLQRAAAQRRRPAAHRVALEHAASAAPAHVAAVAPFARLLSSEGAHEEASRRVAAIVPADEADARATRILRAEVALAGHQVEAAAAAFAEGTPHRDELAVLRSIAEAAASEGLLQAAASALGRIVALGGRPPADWSPRHDLAIVLLGLGRAREAVAMLEAIRPVGSPDAEIDRDLAGALLAAGRARQAADLLRALTRSDPTTSLWLDLALAEREAGNLDAALAATRSAVESAPSDPVPAAVLGELLVERGDRPGATAAFRRALALRPDWPRALSGLRALGAAATP